MTKRDELNQIMEATEEYNRDAAKYPVGTKLVTANNGPVAEIVAADGLGRTVRTNGVDRPATVGRIDAYVAAGKIVEVR